MAGGFSMRGGGVAAAAALVLMLAVSAAAAARPVQVKDSTCPTADEYVYPHWSFCNAPAQWGEKYHYVAAAGLGGLEAEYDVSNSTYYVRFTGSFWSSGAAYVALAAGASEESGTLLVNATVYIFNAQNGRVLQWRKEGSDEYFLIEKHAGWFTEGAPFRFVQAKNTLLPCPLIYPPAQCQAYYLVSDPDSSASFTSAGLLAHPEEGATYVKAASAGSTGDLPLLIQIGTSSAAAAMYPLPTIRTVTRDQ